MGFNQGCEKEDDAYFCFYDFSFMPAVCLLQVSHRKLNEKLLGLKLQIQ